jgi:hypothetical protein
MIWDLALRFLFVIGLTIFASCAMGQDAQRAQPELQSRQGEEPKGAVELTARQPVQLVWKLEPGRRLYQELIVTQKSSCQVQGLDVTTGLKYFVLSSFTVEDITTDGAIIVRQKVEATRLLEADAMAQSVFGDLLKKLAGATFRLTLSPQMEIVALEAAEGAFPIATGGNPMAGQPLMMASLVDRDGWRELDQLTFFQPGRTLKTNDRWQQPVDHSWGPLGNWRGQADYRYEGESDGLAEVVYDLKLAHQPPDAKAAGTLPFRPTDTTFQTERAGGIILFDRQRGRVEQAAETFHVRGSMAIEVFGQKVSIGVTEEQDFRLRIYENRLGGRSTTESGEPE